MKKWWIGVAAFVLVLLIAVVWALFQQPSVRVVRHDPNFVVYDARYYPQTNPIFYWRAAWRDTLGFFGFEKGRRRDRGPALVVYHSVWIGPSRPWLPNPTWVIPDGEPNGGWLCKSLSCEFFGSNKCVTKFFCPLTNGHYHLRIAETNWADIEVHSNLKP